MEETMNQQNQGRKPASNRRDFLKTSTAAMFASTVVSRLGNVPYVHAAGSDMIKVGLIGCGSRGSGAADQAVRGAPNVKLVAMGDAFKDRLDESRQGLIKQHGDKIDVPPDRCFVGFDACQKVLSSDINYVILATPPGFRPSHLKAAVAAGKNIFTEKPVAVDGPGIRTCFAVHEEAKAKGLFIGAGTQRHHQTGYLETLKQIHDGAIGQIVAARGYWNQGPIWVKKRQPEWSDMEYQMRNWYYFTWLCGDHIVEQHVHNLDVVNWAMKSHPVRAVGMGGRQVRTGPEYGNIYDHFAIDYEYDNDVHMMSMARQTEHCENNVSEALVGTKGFCQVNRYAIKGEKPWRFKGKDNDPYLQEHTDLIESIRSGKPVNELKAITESTLTAIMGRMSAYTGKAVTWDEALNSQQDLMPTQLSWTGNLPTLPVAMPGQTQLA
jgi:myo-inositol 2-dehydrogenase / D-chiro-inositol 1-dehydrogenase